MITKYGKVTITQDGIIMEDFTFDEGQPVNDAAKWAITKLEELLSDRPITGIIVEYPGWIEI